MNHLEHFTNARRQQLTRRWFFKECGVGLGTVALGSLLASSSPPRHPRPP